MASLHLTLNDLMLSLNGTLPKNERPYAIKKNNVVIGYVLAKSPARAAMQAVEVETVKQRDCYLAAMAALGTLAKEQSSES